MSQQAVEGTLGRLITDSEFRRGFYADPTATCLRESLDLTTRELEALMALDQTRLQVFAKGIDGRIVRASLGGTQYWSSWAGAARERGKPGPSTHRPRVVRAAK